MAAKVTRKFQEGDVLFAHIVENADRADLLAGKPDDLSPRTAELALQRLRPLHRRVEMPLKQSVENFHLGISGDCLPPKDNIGRARWTGGAHVSPPYSSRGHGARSRSAG